jgi:hypothetical protein
LAEDAEDVSFGEFVGETADKDVGAVFKVVVPAQN